MNTLQISTASGDRDGNNSRLRYVLNTSMNLDSYIALGSIDLWYNWRNITESSGNNTLKYREGHSIVSVRLPDGSYTVKTINDFLHHTMESNGHFDFSRKKGNDERYAISLYENTTYNRITLKKVLGTDVAISFGAGLARVLGADPDTYYTATTNFPNVPQLENVISVQVHCNLVSNQFQRDSSLLYTFSPNNSFGSLLSITPRYPQWRRTRNTIENKVEVWLTDQNGKLLPLEDHWGVVLVIADKELVRV